MYLVACEDARDRLPLHLRQFGVLCGSGLDDHLATEWQSFPLELFAVGLVPGRVRLGRLPGVLHDAIELSRVRPEACREAGLRQKGSDACDTVLVESLDH